MAESIAFLIKVYYWDDVTDKFIIVAPDQETAVGIVNEKYKSFQGFRGFKFIETYSIIG